MVSGTGQVYWLVAYLLLTTALQMLIYLTLVEAQFEYTILFRCILLWRQKGIKSVCCTWRKSTSSLDLKCANSADLPVSIDRGEKGERSARRKAPKTSGRRRESPASKTNQKIKYNFLNYMLLTSIK
jgi:hypothetical protein